MGEKSLTMQKAAQKAMFGAKLPTLRHSLSAQTLKLGLSAESMRATSTRFSIDTGCAKMSGGKRDDDDFMQLVTALSLGFPPRTVSVEEMTKKRGSAPQLVAHLSKMEAQIPEPQAISLSVADIPTRSLHWPRRG